MVYNVFVIKNDILCVLVRVEIECFIVEVCVVWEIVVSFVECIEIF